MLVYFGTSLFGRVDEVPQRFYVATAFFHIFGFPLIPVRSYIVQWKTLPELLGHPIPHCGRSILTAWFRAVMIAAPIFAVIVAMFCHGDRSAGARQWRSGTKYAGGIGLALLPFSYLPVFRRASPQRAHELAAILGVPFDTSMLSRAATDPSQSRSGEVGIQSREVARKREPLTTNRWRETPPGPSA